MKKVFLVFLTGLFCLGASAQFFPDYGNVKLSEVDLKECEFDKDANAVILLHEASSDHDDQYRLITNHHIRLKILKEPGIEEGNVRIRFHSRDHFEMISGVQGRIYNHDGSSLQFTDLEKKAIFTKNINKYVSEVVFAFPNVKVGSIIEYVYQSTMTHYGGLEDWQFQDELPVVKSKYSLVVIPNYEFAYKVQKVDAYPIKIDRDKNSGKIVFEMNNLPGLVDEPYMDARKDYVQRAVFQLSGYNGTYSKKYSTNWTEMIRELIQSESFGSQLGKNLSGTEDFIKQVKLEPSKTKRLYMVINYVRGNMSSNGFSGIYSSDGIKNAWSKKTGHTGEMNLILANLLREAEIDASPLLVSERDNGKVNPAYPFMDQFNRVYVYAVADGKKYYLDAADKLTPPHIIPNEILNTNALIVNRKTGGLIAIADDSFEYRDNLTVNCKLSADGVLNGQAFASSTDYARTRRLGNYLSAGKDKYVETLTHSGTVRIDSFAVINEDVDTLAFQQKFLFETNLNSTGDYLMFPITIFSDLKKNPFLSKTRVSTVNFGYRQAINNNYYLTIPEGLTPDVLPKSVRVTNEDKSISFLRSIIWDPGARRVITRISLTMTKSQYEVEDYPALQEFYKKMFDLLEEQIVFKRS